ncbi:MAG: TonB-dependent receptor plug domain-containing protein [Saprospiraceae bacterium]
MKEILLDGAPAIDVGTLPLAGSGSIDVAVTDELIPTITIADDDSEGGGAQNISGVLSASNDAFISAAAFIFGSARFNIRGYDARYSTVLLNGMPFNELETGDVFFQPLGVV